MIFDRFNIRMGSGQEWIGYMIDSWEQLRLEQKRLLFKQKEIHLYLKYINSIIVLKLSYL